MKKLKSLKTLSSIGAVVTITPLVAAGCTSANNAKSLDEDKSAIKTSLSSFNWSNGGNYFTSMSDEDVIAEFKKQNPAGVNNLPEDIYDNVNFIIKRVTNTIWQITLNANKDSSSYYGSVFANLNIKTNINDYNWNFDAGNYNALMSEQDVINQFKMVNPAGENGLPEDIYDEKNVDVTANGSGKNWDIYLSTTNSLKYGSSIIKTLSVSGGMIYAGKLYTLAENIDPNKFCGTDDWIIPTKESGDVTITDHQLLKELCFVNNNCTEIGDNFLYQSGVETLDISNISNLKTVGHYFLYNCSYLMNLKLPKDTIESIGNYFLYNCHNLRGSIDLTSYKETSIPNNFMVNCFNLDSVNLSGLSQVTYIDHGFLTGFLGSLDISDWTSMKDVTLGFLPATLSSLKMDNWTQITKSSANFFPNEMSLKTISLDGWTNVKTIEKNAFPTNVEELNLTGFSSMTTCSSDYWPKNIKSLNLSGWTSMTECHSSWWPDSATTLNLSGWTSMETVSNGSFNKNVKS
ncbi:MAG: leucine-rich repeat protein, partial [Malacoplasma sp.]|nr:leucine-rich repeat protein [Malacoplasma sp.]